jgi:hypothetical protein
MSVEYCLVEQWHTGNTLFIFRTLLVSIPAGEYSCPLQAELQIAPHLGHNCFLPDSFHSIICRSSYHALPYSLDIDIIIK